MLLDGLLGALIGGILAGIGGFLATRYAVGKEEERDQERRHQDEQAKRDDLIAALRIVRHELVTNATSIDMFVKFGRLSHEPSDDAYRSVQLLLARHLPAELRVKIVHAYNMIPFATVNVASIQAKTSPNPTKATEVVASVMGNFADAADAARVYMVDTLGVNEFEVA